MYLGTCEIRVESVHPLIHEAETIYEIAPDEFREMTGWVIRNCVQGVSGDGGIITRNISNVVDYLSTPNANLFPEAYRMKPSPHQPCSSRCRP